MARFGTFASGTSADLKPCLAASRRRSSPMVPQDIPGEAKLAEHERRLRQRRVVQAGSSREHDRQIAGGLLQAHAADHIGKYVLTRQAQAPVPMRHREQHGEPIAVDSNRHTARVRAEAPVDEHLNLDQERARPFAHDRDRTARHRLGVPRDRKIAEGLATRQLLLEHGEHADLIGRTDLDRASIGSGFDVALK